jgi:excisionase family DNA binding protein
MDNYLTVKQVQELLRVDRITVYRMLKDGRLKGNKIGQQWRFPSQEVDRLLNQSEPVQLEVSGSFPTHCVQTIQDLFSDVGQTSALVVDALGEPLTQISMPCRFCQEIQAAEAGLQACRESWQGIAAHAASGSTFSTCHAGLQYIAGPVKDADGLVGFFLAGEFYWQAPDRHEESVRVRGMAQTYGLDPDALLEAAGEIPVIDPAQQARVAVWPITAARAVKSILSERTGFMNRLQKIADLTQLH